MATFNTIDPNIVQISGSMRQDFINLKKDYSKKKKESLIAG